MKIECKDRGTKEFYDEILFLSMKRKDFLNNPKMKMLGISKYYKSYMLLAIFSIILMLVFYYIFEENIFLIFLGMMVLLLVYCLLSYRKMMVYVNQMLSTENATSVDINEDGINFHDDKKDIFLKWNDIHSIIKAKHSISFLPKNVMDYIISIRDKYTDEVLTALKENDKESLIINKE